MVMSEDMTKAEVFIDDIYSEEEKDFLCIVSMENVEGNIEKCIESALLHLLTS